MTTTPAPLDLDTLKALERAATPGPWVREWAFNTHFVVPEAAKSVAADNVSRLKPNQRADAAFIAAVRNALPALLDELANERWLRENAGKVCDNAVAATHEIAKQRDAALDELATERRQGAAMASITGEAIRQIGEERDAAREELAKVRAELGRAVDLMLRARLYGNLPAALREQIDAFTAEKAEANPATTAEPADKHQPECVQTATCCSTCLHDLGECCKPGHAQVEPTAG